MCECARLGSAWHVARAQKTQRAAVMGVYVWRGRECVRAQFMRPVRARTSMPSARACISSVVDRTEAQSFMYACCLARPK